MGYFPAGTIFNFKKLSMQSGRSLTVTSTATGLLTVTTTSFYAGGALTITNTGGTPALTVADSFGPLHVAGALTVTGNVAITAASLYAGSTTTIGNTTATAVAHNLGRSEARVTVNGTTSTVVEGDTVPGGSPAFTISSINSGVVTFAVINGILDNGASSIPVYLGLPPVRATLESGQSYDLSVLSIAYGVYTAGALSVTGRVSLRTTSLLANSTVTINNTTTTPTSANLGNVRSAGAFSVSGPVSLTTTALYSGSTATIGNTSATALTDNLGAVYAVGNLGVSGNVALNATSSVYAGADATFTGPASGTTTHTFGLVFANGYDKTLAFTGNVQIKATAVVSYGNFTISGATTPLQDWLGSVFVRAFSDSDNAAMNTGDVNWSGTASVTSKNYLTPTAAPLPMWMGRYWSRTGTYNDEYGSVWVPGNSNTSVVFGSTGTSSIFCPLLCTTEKTTVSGKINFGSRVKPMVYFYMCDNNGIYPQVVDWACTGTYYGLMVINESTINITNGVAGTPSVQGAIFAGCPYDPTYTSGMSQSDIVLNGYFQRGLRPGRRRGDRDLVAQDDHCRHPGCTGVVAATADELTAERR